MRELNQEAYFKGLHLESTEAWMHGGMNASSDRISKAIRYNKRKGSCRDPLERYETYKGWSFDESVNHGIELKEFLQGSGRQRATTSLRSSRSRLLSSTYSSSSSKEILNSVDGGPREWVPISKKVSSSKIREPTFVLWYQAVLLG